MTNDFERQISLQGAINFRDLGGYRTADGRSIRTRRLFRSAELHHLTEADLAFTRDKLGIETVIDLREFRLIERGEATHLGHAPNRFHNIPILITPNRLYGEGQRPQTLADGYLMALDAPDVQQSLVETLNTIAQAAVKPLVFHCTLGKDRTGLTAAFILGVLGIPEDDIVADYALSEGPARQVIEQYRRDPEVNARLSKLPEQLFHAYPETMAQVLETLNGQYGSIRKFLLASGANEALFDRLEEVLLVQNA